MGLEVYITRAEFWADNAEKKITAEEWLAYVASDSELTRDPQGKYLVLWSGPSSYDEPWLDWSRGNIKTKWPDTALFRKMLKIAATLGAQVQDDDGKIYLNDTDWQFDPKAK
jgi:hypothetical protein